MSLVFGYWLSITLRFVLMSSLDSAVLDRPEISSPVTSYKRLTEGIRLAQDGGDPYDGEIFHETPLVLRAFEYLHSHGHGPRINSLFIFLDLLTAFALGRLAQRVAEVMLKRQASEAGEYHEDAADLLVGEEEAGRMAGHVQLAYLFHPYVVATCAAKATSVVANCGLALFLLAMVSGRRVAACVLLAFATYQSFYPVMLIVPLCVALHDSSRDIVLEEMREDCMIASICMLNFDVRYFQATLHYPHLTQPVQE